MRRLGLVNIGQAAGEREAAAVAATKTRLPVKRTKPSFLRPFRVAPPRKPSPFTMHRLHTPKQRHRHSLIA
ncbi:hypothetical protein FF1_017509 [Malus domestica]